MTTPATTAATTPVTLSETTPATTRVTEADPVACAAGPADPVARFWDRVAAGYAAKPVADEAGYARKLAMTQAHLHPGMEVLELGCGTGSTALVHAPHVAHIRATDISGAMLAIARDKARAAGIANVTFERGSVEALDVPDASVDAVLALSLLHLLEDRRAALARIHAMLKPGGVFVSSTVCIRDFLAVLALVVPIGRALGLLPVLRVFRGETLVAEVEEAGFEIVERWRPARNKALFLIARKPA